MEISAFQSFKRTLAALSNLSQDALHVYVGLAVFFATVIMFRRSLTSLLPVLAVFAAAVLGELLDMRDDLNRLGYWRWRASLFDIANTVFWPIVIWLLASYVMPWHQARELDAGRVRGRSLQPRPVENEETQ